MERILALQALSTGVTSYNNELLGSDTSNQCSSESSQACSAQSIGCIDVDKGTVDFW
jgi:hypothetical protein